jgi:hypothetical protein
MGDYRTTVMKFTPNAATHSLRAAIARSLVFYDANRHGAQLKGIFSQTMTIRKKI